MVKVRPSNAVLVLACLALLGGGGVAYGTATATGQLVNVVDPKNPAHRAAVDAGGSLKVKQTLPAPFSRSISVPNFYTSFGLTTLLQTHATLAIDRLNFSVEDSGASSWDGAIWYQKGDTTTCNGSTTRIAVEAAHPGESHLDSFQVPVQLKPDAPGHVWCLEASFGPFDTTTDGAAYLDVSGSIVSGKLSPPVGGPQGHEKSSPTGE